MLEGKALAVPTAAAGRSQAEHSLGEMRVAHALYRRLAMARMGSKVIITPHCILNFYRK